MAAQNIQIRVSDGTDFDDIFHPETVTAQVSDLLDVNSKIKLSWIPESLLGTPYSAGVIGIEDAMSEIIATLDAWLTNMGYDISTEALKVKARMGKYIIAATTETIAVDLGHQVWYSEQGETLTGTEGDSPLLTIENGDRLQYTGYSEGVGAHTWAVINNTYSDATTDLKGVVKLATTTATTGDIDVGTDTTKAVTPAGAKRAASVHHPNGGAATGTYHEVTVDTKGHISAGANPTTLAGYGITDAAPSSHVGAGGTAHSYATDELAGFTELATLAEAKAGSGTTQVLTPATGKALVDVFATIVHGATLPAMTTEAERALQPAGKLFLLHV